LENVREGMVVVDSQGRRIGTVVRVRLGYPEAVTAEGADLDDRLPRVAVAATPNADNIQPVGAAIPVAGDRLDPDLPEELREELLRTGFIEVHGSDLKGAARYIHGDQIAEISGDTIRLRP
jgi:hypothetical protein